MGRLLATRLGVADVRHDAFAVETCDLLLPEPQEDEKSSQEGQYPDQDNWIQQSIPVFADARELPLPPCTWFEWELEPGPALY